MTFNRIRHAVGRIDENGQVKYVQVILEGDRIESTGKIFQERRLVLYQFGKALQNSRGRYTISQDKDFGDKLLR